MTDVKSPRDKAVTSRARDVSPLRKKPRLHYVVTKSSSKKVSSVEKTRVGTAPSSSAKVKHLMAQIARRLAVCEMFGTFRSSLLLTSS